MKETAVDHAQLAAFVAVADAQSFTQAARTLGLTKGTVSRVIAKLEARLGAELIHRTTHTVALSTAGVALYERVAPHLAALDQAVLRLPERAPTPSGELHITVPPDFSLVVLPDILVHFARRYPDVTVRVDTSHDEIDLVGQGFDLAIRVARSALKDSSLVSRRLGHVGVGFYAAPTYLARRGWPRHLGEANHDWILHSSAHASRFPRGARARFHCDDFLLIRNLARDGGGVGLLPVLVALPLVREGLLEEVPLVDQPAMQGSLFVVYPSSGQVSRKVTAFRDFLVEWFKKTPLQ